MPVFRHSRFTNVLVDDYELSNYFRASSFSASADTAETTTYQVAAKTFIPGQHVGMMSLEGLFSAEANGVEEKLRGVLGASSGHIATIAPEGYEYGKLAQCIISAESSLQLTNTIADVITLTTEFNCKDTYGTGVILKDGNTPLNWNDALIGTTNNSALTTFGGFGVLHAWSNTLNQDIDIEIQHANPSLVWINLGSFTTISAGTTSSSFFLADFDVEENLRWSATTTATSGSIEFITMFCRFNS